MSTEELTPFAEALALLQQGAPESTITERLRARGLDDESIGVVIRAATSRWTDEKPPPTLEWAEPPAGAAPPSALAPETPAPPAEDLDATIGTCTRCGVFVTPRTRQLVLDKLYCQTCAARPDVNYLGAFRAARWGKRDSWAWYYGVLAVFSLLSGIYGIAEGMELYLLLVPLVGTVVYASFWAGWPGARPALALPLIALVVEGLAENRAFNIPGLSLGIAFAVAAVRNPRTKLFFKLELTEKELAAAWAAYQDNRPARWARRLAVVALLSLLPFVPARSASPLAWVTGALGMAAAALGAVGLSRVRPDATPPVGRRGAALFGLVAGVLCAFTAATLLLWPLLRR